MQVAQRTGRSIAEAQKTTSAIEFLRWRLLIVQEMQDEYDKEWKQRHREDLYSAQVAMYVAALCHKVDYVLAKDRPAFDKKVEDFMLPLDKLGAVAPEQEEVEQLVDDEEAKRRSFDRKLVAAKASWFAYVGLKDDGTADPQAARERGRMPEKDK